MGEEKSSYSSDIEENRYVQIVREIFTNKYVVGDSSVEFTRDDLISTCQSLGVAVPKNPGDILYSFRYRNVLPKEIVSSAPPGKTWIIIGEGRAKYAFKLSSTPYIEPNHALQKIKIPDNTPEVIERYSITDEQGVLSKVRYNRLIDIFLGITTFSLQNHLRTTVKGIGQIEIDELYVGINKKGQHFVIPVQAKGPKDKIGVVQLKQDITYCSLEKKFTNLICAPIAVQYLDDNVICMFHLDCEDYNAQIVDEKHYQLVPSNQISDEYVKKLRDLL
ncbi:hypothetical protein [Paenibacillus thermotolerans]|uniref:hypothetical protein n=1 Tax=Paenibacillus thermotolerans TaxID=3027807 RepID=UPI002367F84D|nr:MULTISPECIES: hypothetical protein [unclassified Paenibacillus]